MIRFENVTKTYAGGKTKAVDGLTMEIDGGKVFGFLGPNGAGKTTTIKMMTGILNPTEGEIWLENINLQKNPIEAKRTFGFVPDSFEMFERLSGMEYLNFLADLYRVGNADRKTHIEKYLAMFDLESAVNQPIRSYSHGMKQKLQVIGSLIHQPSIWILDEPMTGLDPASIHALKEEMRAYCDSGKTVFFSTHVLDMAERLCDEVGIIRKGKLITRGAPETLMKDDQAKTLEDLFLNLTEKEEQA
ncbi:MAG: ABC transporter ATP-binding protein [Eubacteriales bacterium]|nr:ABC transporter ATP-binding protein [Eubacteriales bacterium]